MERFGVPEKNRFYYYLQNSQFTLLFTFVGRNSRKNFSVIIFMTVSFRSYYFFGFRYSISLIKPHESYKRGFLPFRTSLGTVNLIITFIIIGYTNYKINSFSKMNNTNNPKVLSTYCIPSSRPYVVIRIRNLLL